MMSDDNDSGGIIGAIISIFILIAIWPYLLAILGLYIAYIAFIAVLEWIAHNPQIVVLTLLGALLIYVVVRYRLMPKAWKSLIKQFQAKAIEVDLSQSVIAKGMPNLSQRPFIPTSNLYCYWCTRKLGLQAYEQNGKYYCSECAGKLDFLNKSA